ncbi:unnamed protein product [Amoebophrya sp. A25]|nr:unnamed protein product [Amoebophrya sp. A25]|eukprot:GSA25T00005808001.1
MQRSKGYECWPDKVDEVLLACIENSADKTRTHLQWAFQYLLWALRTCYQHAHSWISKSDHMDGTSLRSLWRLSGKFTADDLHLRITEYFCDKLPTLWGDVQVTDKEAVAMQLAKIDVDDVHWFNNPAPQQFAAADNVEQLIDVGERVGLFVLLHYRNSTGRTCCDVAPEGGRAWRWLRNLAAKSSRFSDADISRPNLQQMRRLFLDTRLLT